MQLKIWYLISSKGFNNGNECLLVEIVRCKNRFFCPVKFIIFNIVLVMLKEVSIYARK